jgi:hypothetical protein
MLLQMALLVAVVSAAVLYDVYVENNSIEEGNVQSESTKHTTEKGGMYLIGQTGSTTVKTYDEKLSVRKLKVQLHDKFLRKYHQIRNYQILSAEAKTQTTPLIHSYHYLVFQNYFFIQPDEDPLS